MRFLLFGTKAICCWIVWPPVSDLFASMERKDDRNLAPVRCKFQIKEPCKVCPNTTCLHVPKFWKIWFTQAASSWCLCVFPNTDRMSLQVCLFFLNMFRVTKSFCHVWSFSWLVFPGSWCDLFSRCQATHPRSWDWNRRPWRLTRSLNTSSSRSNF